MVGARGHTWEGEGRNVVGGCNHPEIAGIISIHPVLISDANKLMNEPGPPAIFLPHLT